MEPFHEGQKIWGRAERRLAARRDLRREAELASWFGGGPGVYVVYPDSRSGEEVAAARVVPRNE